MAFGCYCAINGWKQRNYYGRGTECELKLSHCNKPSSALLGYCSDRRTLSTDDSADHLTGHEYSQRKIGGSGRGPETDRVSGVPRSSGTPIVASLLHRRFYANLVSLELRVVQFVDHSVNRQIVQLMRSRFTICPTLRGRLKILNVTNQLTVAPALVY